MIRRMVASFMCLRERDSLCRIIFPGSFRQHRCRYCMRHNLLLYLCARDSPYLSTGGCCSETACHSRDGPRLIYDGIITPNPLREEAICSSR